MSYSEEDGIIGDKIVHFQKDSIVGEIEFVDSLLIQSKAAFSTICANVSVYKGKWQFEITLFTKGIIQIGFANVKCKFLLEKGVGDVTDSYCYDGKRCRKWNFYVQEYGQNWEVGDVVGCCIDLQKGCISYLLNGQDLGIAFDNVKVSASMAYCPAISLARTECILANFGSYPFSFPKDGYKAFFYYLPIDERTLNENYRELLTHATRCKDSSPVLIKNCSPVFEQFDKIRRNYELLIFEHGMQRAFLPVLYKMVQSTDGKIAAEIFLQVLSVHFIEKEDDNFFTQLINSLSLPFTQTPLNSKFNQQLDSLQILQICLKNENIRKYLLKNILFKDFRFLLFFQIKCPSDLSTDFTRAFITTKSGDFTEGDFDYYKEELKKMENVIEGVRNEQINLLSHMLTIEDGSQYQETSRSVFFCEVEKLRKVLLCPNSGLPAFISRECLYGLFYCALKVFEKITGSSTSSKVTAETAATTTTTNCNNNNTNALDIRIIESSSANSSTISGNSNGNDNRKETEWQIENSIFYNNFVDFFESTRLGGLESHIKRNLTDQKIKDDLQALEALPENEGLHDSGGVAGSLKRDASESIYLSRFFDLIVNLYHNEAHLNIKKSTSKINSYFELVNHYKTLKHLGEAKKNKSNPFIAEELRTLISVAKEKLLLKWRRVSFLLANYTSARFVQLFVFLLKKLSDALLHCSSIGEGMSFVPNYYIESFSHLLLDCKSVMVCRFEVEGRADFGSRSFFLLGNLDVSGEIVQAYGHCLLSSAQFLSLHVSDKRIVVPETKDLIMETLASFITHLPSCRILETVHQSDRKVFITQLISSFHTRCWTHSSWVLTRIWKGMGFGFAYKKPPYLSLKLGPIPTNFQSVNFTEAIPPYHSKVFVKDFHQILLSDTKILTSFVNILLNRLNWALSEFIGMLNEICSGSNSNEKTFVESRQLHLCVTWFDLATCLLRVTEMTVEGVAQSILNTEFLIQRLVQTLCQVVNRICSPTESFCRIVSLGIPGLHSLQLYPIATPVMGCLCALLKMEVLMRQSEPFLPATSAFLSEANFNVDILYTLFGHPPCIKNYQAAVNQSGPKVPETFEDFMWLLLPIQDCNANSTAFCCRKYPNDISQSQLHSFIKAIHHLEDMKARQLVKGGSAGNDNEESCTICYSQPALAIFMPCEHTSCMSCIRQQLMNSPECFFCKVRVERVVQKRKLTQQHS